MWLCFSNAEEDKVRPDEGEAALRKPLFALTHGLHGGLEGDIGVDR